MHYDCEQQAHRVHEQVALAPVHFLLTVIAMRASTLGGFDGLTIANPSTGVVLRPACTRRRSRSVLMRWSRKPALRRLRK